MTRFDAYVALLALPDPLDLPARARRYTQLGSPLLRDQIKLYLERAWLRHRAQAFVEETEIVLERMVR